MDVDDPEGFYKACAFRHDPRNYCDGVIFDRHYVLGEVVGWKPRLPGGDNHRSGSGYPSCDIAGGKMYIVDSRSKEDIYFAKLDVSALN